MARASDQRRSDGGVCVAASTMGVACGGVAKIVAERAASARTGRAATNAVGMASLLHVVILAAGEGKRMNSARPKVLHRLAGRPMLAHVIATARELGADRIHVVHGH